MKRPVYPVARSEKRVVVIKCVVGAWNARRENVVTKSGSVSKGRYVAEIVTVITGSVAPERKDNRCVNVCFNEAIGVVNRLACICGHTSVPAPMD